MEAKGQLQKKTAKLLFIFLMIATMVVLSSAAYAQIIWLAYDDFSSERKSVQLWTLSNTNMCDEYLSYFQNGKMIQEADVNWFGDACYFNEYYQNRVRANANATVASYINGLSATVKIDELDNYYFPSTEFPPGSGSWINQNSVRARLAAILFNDEQYANSGNGQDLTSDIWATIDVREGSVGWTVIRFKDSVGLNADFLGGGSLLNPWGLYDPTVTQGFRGVPLTLNLWFDGKKIYFSVQVKKSSKDIIEVAATYTPKPGLPILPQKSSPLMRFETLIDVSYLYTNQPIIPNKDVNDQSRIKAQWDNVWVAVKPTNLGTVKQIIHNASKGKPKWK